MELIDPNLFDQRVLLSPLHEMHPFLSELVARIEKAPAKLRVEYAQYEGTYPDAALIMAGNEQGRAGFGFSPQVCMNVPMAELVRIGEEVILEGIDATEKSRIKAAKEGNGGG